MITESRRDQFWREVDRMLRARTLEPATNGEIEDVIKRTTCPRQAADFIARLRQLYQGESVK